MLLSYRILSPRSTDLDHVTDTYSERRSSNAQLESLHSDLRASLVGIVSMLRPIARSPAPSAHIVTHREHGACDAAISGR